MLMITRSLFDPAGKSIYRSQLMFRNRNHEVHTVKVNKVALNRDDNKQIVKKDGASTTHYAGTPYSVRYH